MGVNSPVEPDHRALRHPGRYRARHRALQLFRTTPVFDDLLVCDPVEVDERARLPLDGTARRDED